MYRSSDILNGMGPTVFRSPGEIREDILYIKVKIEETRAALNLRELVTSILADERESDSKKLINSLSDAVDEAKAALRELRELENELYELEEELKEVRWIMGC